MTPYGKTLPPHASSSASPETQPEHCLAEGDADGRTLETAVRRFVASETVSFHTPGHKGRLSWAEPLANLDVTELPGLDDLANPSGILLALERRIASTWGTRSSFISTNGASACLIAALLAFSQCGRKFVLMPRNAHRSLITAMVLSGLDPVWYEPEWLPKTGVWGATQVTTVERHLHDYSVDLAAVVVVSPTYTGHLSRIADIAPLCKKHGVPLIVDEAHGAHMTFAGAAEYSAIDSGADIVVHSLHKTMTALTQTGVLHRVTEAIDDNRLRLCLSMAQSTSPSYLLLQSVENCVRTVEAGYEQTMAKLGALALALKEALGLPHDETALPTSPTHIYLPSRNPAALFADLLHMGVTCEAVLGDGVLLLLGWATSQDDIQKAISSLARLSPERQNEMRSLRFHDQPALPEQVLGPRQAFLLPSHLVSVDECDGLIAAECIATCPPGYPQVVPGQKLNAAHLEGVGRTNIRVVRTYD